MERRKIMMLVGLALFVVAGSLAFRLLRPKNPCLAALGPLEDLESVTHETLVPSKASGPYDGVCSAYVSETGSLAKVIASVDREKISFELEKQKWSREKFASSSPLSIGDEGVFFEASKEKTPTAAEITDRLKKGGAMLGPLPVEEHVAVSRLGEYVFVLKFNRDAFTADAAKAESAAILGRAHMRR